MDIDARIAVVLILVVILVVDYATEKKIDALEARVKKLENKDMAV